MLWHCVLSQRASSLMSRAWGESEGGTEERVVGWIAGKGWWLKENKSRVKRRNGDGLRAKSRRRAAFWLFVSTKQLLKMQHHKKKLLVNDICRNVTRLQRIHTRQGCTTWKQLLWLISGWLKITSALSLFPYPAQLPCVFDESWTPSKENINPIS